MEDNLIPLSEKGYARKQSLAIALGLSLTLGIGLVYNGLSYCFKNPYSQTREQSQLPIRSVEEDLSSSRPYNLPKN